MEKYWKNFLLGRDEDDKKLYERCGQYIWSWLGDKFNIKIVAYDKDYEHNPCYFSEEGIMSCEDKNVHLILLHCLLTGELEINKLK